MKILLTGGLGYIGSHIAHLLNNKAVIIDNFSNSKLNYKRYLPSAIVYKANLNCKNLNFIFNKYKISSVIHLAGSKSVNDSVINPLKYYKNNFNSTLDLLESMQHHNINNLIFSSSATVYGDNLKSPLKEIFKTEPNNPYGNTKLFIEKLITDFSKSRKNFKAISLRYFNPIGSNYTAGLFDQPVGEKQNLIPKLIESVIKKKKLEIYGDDYLTIDGTGVRDYIHVMDLAQAHLSALKILKDIKGHEIINIGLGRGISVLELIKKFENYNKIKVNYEFKPRRPGDVPISFADSNKARKILPWKPQLNYKDMVIDAWKAAKFKKK